MQCVYSENAASCNGEIIKLNEKLDDERFIIIKRCTKFQLNDESLLCVYHANLLINKYHPSLFCLDPYGLHKTKAKGCADVSLTIAKVLGLVPGAMLCASCYKAVKLNYERALESSGGTDGSDPSFRVSQEPDYSSQSSSQDSPVSLINRALIAVGESPFSTKYPISRRASYVQKKFDKSVKPLLQVVQDKLIPPTPATNVDTVMAVHTHSTEQDDIPIISTSDYEHLVCEIKVKFDSTHDANEKLKLLTLAPKSWYLRQVMEFFNCTYAQAVSARNAREYTGILTCRPPKINRPLSEATKQLVKQFFADDIISRIMPGVKDKIKVGGVIYQKHLLLMNLKEAYVTFKERHSDIKVGFSSFALLRPKHVILPDGAGIHRTCVCIYCENAKLMLLAVPGSSRIADLFEYSVCSIYSYKCMFEQCVTCKGELSMRLQQELQHIDPNADVQYKQWTITDQEVFSTLSVKGTAFCDTLISKMSALREHFYYHKMQSAFYKNRRENLQEGEALVLFDFAENFGHVHQDEPQSVYYQKPQTTIHPVFIYYCVDGEIRTQAFCAVSDDCQHDVVFVMMLIAKVIRRLRYLNSRVSKVHYLTDGARSQYKNKYILFFLTIHHMLFDGIRAEWHFHATCHGKSPCDGAGATFKRLLRRHCLRLPYDDKITSARRIYEWGKENLEMGVIYIDKPRLHEFRTWFGESRQCILPFAGISKFHSFHIDDDGRTVIAKFTSDGPDFKSLKVTNNEDDHIILCIGILDLM